MFALYKKELRSYFTSMIGYVFVAFFLLVMGIYFSVYNVLNGYSAFEQVMGATTFVFFILTPILTMRVMAEERRQKTDQLLLTAPITVEKIVAGKFLAMATVFGIVMAVCCLYPLILSSYGTVNLVTAYVGILGFVLLGLAFMAMGQFVSTCTENQVVSAVISFIVTLVMYYMGSLKNMFPTDNRSALIIISVVFAGIWAGVYAGLKSLPVALVIYFTNRAAYNGIIAKILGWFSIMDRFSTFTSGAVDLSSIVYLASFTFIFLFLSVQVIKSRRWS